MADTKISALTELTAPVEGDWVAVVDTSASATKKLDLSAINNGGTYIVDPPVEVNDAASAELNRAAIQTQLDAASAAGGGTVLLQEGIYYIADQTGGSALGYCLAMKSKVRFTGQSHAASILKIITGETGAVSMMENSGTIENCEIDHIEWDGTKARVADTQWGDVEHEGIDLKTPTDCFIHNNYIHDCGTDGIDLDSATNCHIQDNIVEDCGGSAIHMAGDGNIITGNNTRGNSYYRLQSATQSVRSSAGAISINTGTGCIIANNRSENDERGVTILTMTNTIVANNVIYQPGQGTNITGTAELDPATVRYSDAGVADSGTAPTGYGHGIYVASGCIACNISNNIVEMRGLPSSGTRAFAVQISGATTLRNVIAASNIKNGAPNIFINGSGDTTVTGGVLQSARSYNIEVNHSIETTLITGVKTYQGAANGNRILGKSIDVTFVGCQARNATGDGFNVIGPCERINFMSCAAEACTDAGIELQNSGGAPIDCSIISCDIRNNTGNNVKDGGTGSVIRGNLGWTTQATGTGSIASGVTTDVITHGLDITPTIGNISVTLAENPTNTPGAIWVDTIDGTNFTVNCENDPGASNLDFGWAVVD